MKHLHYILFVLITTCLAHTVTAQNKTDIPSTFREVCFFTIKKVEFEEYLKVKKAIDIEEYGLVYAAIRKMRTSLKGFTTASHNRAYELWYVGNYTEFDKQAMVSKESTLNSLRNYENRLRTRDAVYYDHRLFLEQYLAFETEAFYPEYWFMSQERYFSKVGVDRINKMNRVEGKKLFSNSEFYKPFEVFNKMVISEDNEIKEYLDVEGEISDTTTFVPYSFMILDKPSASYILQNFNLDDATDDIDIDREVRALTRFLKNVETDKIYLVARFNNIELRKMKELEKAKPKK